MGVMDGFVAGLLIGILLGILLGPVLRSWLLWHEVEAARREAALAEGILARMDGANGADPEGRVPDDAFDGPY